MPGVSIFIITKLFYGKYKVGVQPPALPRCLHGTAQSTVLPVTPDVSPPGVSGGAAPGWVEPTGRGTGRVNHAAVDEGELAGGRTGGGGGGGGGGGIVAPYIAWPEASLGNKVYICVILDSFHTKRHHS